MTTSMYAEFVPGWTTMVSLPLVPPTNKALWPSADGSAAT